MFVEGRMFTRTINVDYVKLEKENILFSGNGGACKKCATI